MVENILSKQDNRYILPTIDYGSYCEWRFSVVCSIFGLLPDIQHIAQFLKDYQGLLSLLLGACLFPLISWIYAYLLKTYKRFRDVKALRSRVGSEIYTRDDILRATKYFIEPDCQSVDPSGSEDFRKVVSTRQPAFKTLDRLFSQDTTEKYTLILGDSGMGKTTLLLNYFARYCKKNPPFQIALVPLGFKGADKAIDAIENRSETVLLLDAFDEDTQAIRDHKGRLAAILDKTEEFRHVLITCRTQFFAQDDEIPKDTGVFRIGLCRAGQSKDYTFQKLYLSTFTEGQVLEYLKSSFPFWRRRQRKLALKVASAIPDLTMRPMLLAHIKDVINIDTPILSSAHIYDSMINAWIARERPYVDPGRLRTFSEDIAVNLYIHREARGAEKISPSEAASFARERGVALEAWQLRGRSLLNRDADGNLKFAHRSFLEYLYIQKFIQDPHFACNQTWTDQMKKFWWEQITSLYHGDRPERQRGASEIQRLIDQACSEGDLSHLESLSLNPMFVLSSAAIDHYSERELEIFCRSHCTIDPESHRWTKRIPGLFQKIQVSQPGNLDRFEVVVDFATGLMWQSSCTRAMKILEARSEKIEDAGGLRGWRLPTLLEALSLLPARSDSTSSYSLFERWENVIWTSDTLRGQVGRMPLACTYHDVKLAHPLEYGCFRLVREFLSA